ncbi:MAG: acyl-CoA thioesterase [Bacillota bacterium]|nr:MAG: acyl-CoA thioesterase [Planctomycetota bacterium]RUA10676.1 MAG: acyl-CoA thioesterase [Bacillota bacterium]
MNATGTSTIRVRYEETDQGAIAHHSRHVVWFETARTEWLRELGMPYQQLEKEGIRFLVSEVTVNYQFPALYDDLLTVETSLVDARGARLQLGYTITSPRGDTVCTGTTTLACIDVDRGRPRRLPVFFQQQVITGTEKE